MSILKSTKSGFNSPLSDNLLSSIGYKRVEGADGVEEHLRFYCTKDQNISIWFVDSKYKFYFKPEMSAKCLEERPQAEKIILSTIGDVKLLEDWWFQTDIKARRKLENKLMLLKEVIEKDDSLWTFYSTPTYMSYSDNYKYKKDYFEEETSYFKSPKRNYKWW